MHNLNNLNVLMSVYTICPFFIVTSLVCIFSRPKRLFSLWTSFLVHSDAEEEGELEPAKELIQPIAEKLMAKYKAKEEEMPLLFFVAGEVR